MQRLEAFDRYRARWIAKGKFYTPEQKTLWGRERQARGVATRRKRNHLDDRDRLIRLDLEQGMTQVKIARKFGLTEARVSQILSLLHR